MLYCMSFPAMCFVFPIPSNDFVDCVFAVLLVCLLVQRNTSGSVAGPACGVPGTCLRVVMVMLCAHVCILFCVSLVRGVVGVPGDVQHRFYTKR